MITWALTAFGEDGRGGEIRVTLRGNRLYESWGYGRAGRDTVRQIRHVLHARISYLERFVRDRSGQVVGIVYTLGSSEIEAKRVQ